MGITLDRLVRKRPHKVTSESEIGIMGRNSKYQCPKTHKSWSVQGIERLEPSEQRAGTGKTREFFYNHGLAASGS